MKTKFLIFATIVVLLSITISCNNTTSKEIQKGIGKEMYACPMHLEISSNTPGTCSKCGMNLEKIEAPVSTDTTKK